MFQEKNRIFGKIFSILEDLFKLDLKTHHGVATTGRVRADQGRLPKAVVLGIGSNLGPHSASLIVCVPPLTIDEDKCGLYFFFNVFNFVQQIYLETRFQIGRSFDLYALFFSDRNTNIYILPLLF